MSKLEASHASESVASEKVSVSNARKDLARLVNQLETEPNKVIELDRRDNPLALLLSFDVYNPIIRAFQTANLNTILANLVANKWLGTQNVPAHIHKPQLEELESMDTSQLLMLFEADPSSELDTLKKKGKLNETLVARLIKRSRVAKVIADAEKENLYETAEHLSGSKTL